MNCERCGSSIVDGVCRTCRDNPRRSIPKPAWAACLMLVALAACGADSPRKPTLALSLDDSPASRMLHAELTRDWMQANPALRLTRRQRSELFNIGHAMNSMQSQIVAQFRIVYVEREEVPLPQRMHLPAIRINRGRWESIDRRAFTHETMPIRTIEWYRTRYVAAFNRDDRAAEPWAWDCSELGYSGPAEIETPAPWAMGAVQKAAAETMRRTDLGFPLIGCGGFVPGDLPKGVPE